jgi:hypothetical protein
MQDLLNNFERIELFDRPELGFVDTPMTPIRPGRVKCLGSIWPAQFNCDSGRTLASGDRVIAVGRAGMSLLVIPESECAKCPKENKQCGKQCLARIYALNRQNLEDSRR